MSAAHILCAGVHVPRLRLARATIAAAMAWTAPAQRRAPAGFRAVCNWDEDALTLGVEAARSCARGEEIDSLYFCSTTAPFADRDDAGMIAAALALPTALRTANFGGGLRAGTGALVLAARDGGVRHALVVASDARLTRPGSVQELAYGDAAAALLIGPERRNALARIVATHGIGDDFVDHYRMSGADFDYALEERWVRDESLLVQIPAAVRKLLANAGISADRVSHFALPAPLAASRRIAEASALGHARRDERVLAECGDAGTALPLLVLIAALERARPGELIIAIGVGQGVDAVLLEAGAAAGPGGGTVASTPDASEDAGPLTRALVRRHEEPSYVRYLSHRGLVQVDFGMRAERDQRTAHTVAHRKHDALAAFVGGRCRQCDSVQFPRSRVCVNPDCRATDTQDPHRLADSQGRVKTFTEDWQAYSARPPYIYGNVEFEQGGNLFMEFSDLESGELQVGDAVRFVYRIKDEDRARGFRRYFWKAVKARGHGT